MLDTAASTARVWATSCGASAMPATRRAEPDPCRLLELARRAGPGAGAEGIAIGAVTGVQGISWTEYTVTGQSNHAGTTPMALRRDAGVAAARIASLREMASEMGPPQVATVGASSCRPASSTWCPNAPPHRRSAQHRRAEALQDAEARLQASPPPSSAPSRATSRAVPPSRA
jgi:beta-ureidopropionase / N-carbamoyl-L-amino-acid hydrolase